MPDPSPQLECFESFMQRALFDPRCGYYSRNIATVGARGDFSTSAVVSPLLGKAVARWLIKEAESQPAIRTIIEVGAGDGSLLATVRQELGWWRRRRFNFHLVEASPVLRQAQQARLGDRVTWFDDLNSALAHCAGQAFIVHNELLDAFPVKLIEWTAKSAEWQEVWLSHEPTGKVVEKLRPLDPSITRDDFAVLRHWTPDSNPPCAGQRCELHTGVKNWLQDWAPNWHQGAMLTIDYGDEFPAIYQRRPRGTLRAYLLHQRLEGADIYANPGRQDITSDVNFSDLRRWFRNLGWRESFHETQSRFIRRFVGERRAGADAAAGFLLDENGAGGAFKCLAVRVGS